MMDEKALAAASSAGQAMPREICCINSRTIIDHVTEKLGATGRDLLLEGLVDNPEYLVADKLEPDSIRPVTLSDLLDADYWVSNEYSLALFDRCAAVLPGARPVHRAGLEGVVNQASLRGVTWIARIASLKTILKRIPHENRKFNRTKDVTLLERSRNRFVFELRYKPGVRVTKHVCNWNLGVYSGYAFITGTRDINIAERQCVVDGAETCQFEVTWKAEPWGRRLQAALISKLAKPFFEAYERERIDKEELLVHFSEKLEARTEELQLSSRTDELTGIPNRRAINERLSETFHECLKHGHNFALLMLDLDRFKHINDTHGHAVGDVVLKTVAERIRHALRDSDFIGRFGGEEFVALLPRSTAQEALPVAHRVREAVGTKPIPCGDASLTVTVSVGISEFPGNAVSTHDLINAADQAMYSAKRNGRNRVEVASSQRAPPPVD